MTLTKEPSSIGTVPAVVAVLGAGLMGHGIAQVFATAGAQVRVWDPNVDALGSLVERVRANLEQLAVLGVELAEPPETIVSRLHPHADLATVVRGAEVIFEAVPEDLQIKRQLLEEVDRINPEAVFATNTSVLRIGDIAAKSVHPERVVGTHWWNPPYLIPLVEVVPSVETSPSVTATVTDWLTGAGKLPVLVQKDVPGFIGNRLQFALWREALHLIEEGICDAESVDLVVRNTFGLRLSSMGPIENADFIGLDLVQAIMRYVLPDLARGTDAPSLVADAVNDRRLGVKTGQGLIGWAEGDREHAQRRLLEGIVRTMTAKSVEREIATPFSEVE